MLLDILGIAAIALIVVFIIGAFLTHTVKKELADFKAELLAVKDLIAGGIKKL